MKKHLLIAALVVALGAVGCKQDNEGAGGQAVAGGEKIKLALLAPASSDFWSIVEAGANKAAKEFNVDCETMKQAKTDPAEQKSKLEDLLAKGVKGVAIAPCDAKNQVDMINDAAKRAIVITTDTDAPTSDRICYVGTNNYDAGVKAGELLKKALPTGGKVVLFVATEGMQNAADRIKGIRETIKGTKIQILEVKTDDGDRIAAKSNVENVISRTPDIAALVGIFSYNGPAIAEVVTSQKLQGKVKVVCFDEDAATLQAVRSGVIEGTVVQDPFAFGYESVRVLAALARKEDAKIPANKIIDTGVKVIDKSSVDAFEADFKQKLGK